MKELFYMIVTNLTNIITGLDGSNLKLWEFETWVRTSIKVTECINYVCLYFAVVIGMILLTYVIRLFYIIKREIKERKLNIVED